MQCRGAKSFVDDLGLSRGVVLSRAAASLRSIETKPFDSGICPLLDGPILDHEWIAVESAGRPAGRPPGRQSGRQAGRQTGRSVCRSVAFVFTFFKILQLIPRRQKELALFSVRADQENTQVLFVYGGSVGKF